MFGLGDGLWTIQSGITFWEQKSQSFDDWTQHVFDRQNDRPMRLEPGELIEGVWRPGIYHLEQIQQAFGFSRADRRAAEQTLHLLVDALQTLFLSVEPAGTGLDAYGPRMRELLILACTEVEDAWGYFMRLAAAPQGGRGWSTNDYVKLTTPLHLDEFEGRLEPSPAAPAFRPFNCWDPAQPTQSLAWYDA